MGVDQLVETVWIRESCFLDINHWRHSLIEHLALELLQAISGGLYVAPLEFVSDRIAVELCGGK